MPSLASVRGEHLRERGLLRRDAGVEVPGGREPLERSTASGACAASPPASASAASSSSSSGTTRFASPHAQRLLGARSARRTRFSSSAFADADEPRQPLRAAEAGDDPELDLGLAEARRCGRDAQIARHRQLAAPAEREAVDGGDRDDRAALEAAQQRVRACDVGAGGGRRPSP